MQKIILGYKKTSGRIIKPLYSFLVILALIAQFFIPLVGTAADIGFNSPSAQVTDTGGNGDGFELNPANAFSDGGGYASNMNGAGDRHRFYNYNFNLPSYAVVDGIEVRLDWWLDSNQNNNSMSVQLSWDGGSSWTDQKTNSAESTSDTNNKILGGSTDTWDRTWSVSDFTNTNFRVRVISNSDSSTRDFYLDWVAVKIYYTEPTVNPPLGQSCGLDIALVIDSSGSIDDTELAQMKNAFKSFVNAFLPGTPTQFSVTDFDTTATVSQGFTGNLSLINAAINSSTSGGWTNWEQGLLKAQSTFDPRTNPNLVIFASDGNPNRKGNSDQPVFEVEAINAAVLMANSLKSSGTRILTLGIGDDLNVENLKKISGPNVDTSITSDVITTNFATLAEDLADLANGLCGGTITARKVIDQDGDIQTTCDQTPGVSWSFDVAGSQQVTDQNGYTQAVKVDAGTYNVSETPQNSYSFIDASCSGATNNGTLSGETISGIQVKDKDIVSCVFYNHPLECITDSDCNDGLYCNGQETCVNNLCIKGTIVDCSNNNLPRIGTCTNDPDNNPFTFDLRELFTSSCNEETNSCTTRDATVNSTCDVTNCQAQCDTTHSCADTVCHTQNGCVGNDYYTYQDVSNTCQTGCTCTTNVCGAPSISYNDPACTECQTNDDCNSLNQDYCEGSAIKHNEGVCINYKCETQTTTTQNCNDGLYCNGQETCSDAQCVSSTPVDCSNNNILGIGICTNSPDGNPFTWDFRSLFTSQCNEDTDSCATGDQTITHTCDVNQCSAQCGVDLDCNDQNINTTDTCNLTTCQCEHTQIPPIECTSGQTRSCETVNQGICSVGTQTCNQSGFWGSCMQTNQPTTENCTNGLDDDCDGLIDAADPSCGTPAPYCGDASCNNGESCSTCSQDCGSCGGGAPTWCGDRSCNGWETCSTCSQDCGSCGGGSSTYCGDGIVNGSEQCDGTAGISAGYTCTTSCALEKVACNMDLDAMIIMDVSGSMGYESPTRLSRAQIAANNFLGNLRSEDQSGLVSFSETAALNKSLSNQHGLTQSAINGLTPSGATNISEAIDKANLELISANANPDALKVQILLTDGLANKPNGDGSIENPNDVALTIAKSLEAENNKIIIFIIGLGNNINTGMLQTVATNTGGQYYSAPTASDLDRIFNQIVYETCNYRTEFKLPALTIYNQKIESVSGNSATVSWYTNIPATSRVVYGQQPVQSPGSSPNYGYDYSTSETDTTNKVIFHLVTIENLIPKTNYYWRGISHASPDEVLGQESTFYTEVVETPQTPGTPGTPGTPTEGGTPGETGGTGGTTGTTETTGTTGGTKTNTGGGVLSGLMAAIGNFFNAGIFCQLLLLLLLILIVLLGLAIYQSRKKKNRIWILTIVILILFWLLYRGQCFWNYWWILLLLAIIVTIVAYFLGERKNKKGKN